MSFRISLSGMNAATADLNVTSNNIANANTTGFKQGRAEFGDVFAASSSGLSRNTIGAGVKLAAIAQQFGQGNIDFTDSSLDLAISGNGFFVMSDDGAISYSRGKIVVLDRPKLERLSCECYAVVKRESDRLEAPYHRPRAVVE